MTVCKWHCIGQVFQSFHRLVSKEQVLRKIHHFHHVGRDDWGNEHIEEYVSNDDGHLSTMSYQDNACRNKNEGKRIDSNGIERHGRAPHKRVLDDKVAITDDAVVEMLERENRLLKHFNNWNASDIFNSICTHFFLCI